MKDLRDTRASISGVNIDEELAEMIKFQHGYSAASRFITTIDEMLDTIHQPDGRITERRGRMI
jgi:flagellar hook-associated protein 1 FlgK